MSRSYKKNNWVKDKIPGGKKAANRAVRRARFRAARRSKGWYRRVYNSWDISDWCFPGRPQDKRK